MSNEKQLARSIGTKFKIDSTAVGSITNLDSPSLSSETTDVTTFDSAEGFREFLPTLKDGGEVPVSGYYDIANAGQKALYDAFEDSEVHACAIEFPNGAGWTFGGMITAYKNTIPMEGVLGFEATVKVSGKPTMTLPASAAAVNADPVAPVAAEPDENEEG